MKDNDFVKFVGHIVLLGPDRDSLLNTLTSDANFLSTHNLMDYSLLVGEIDPAEDLQELKQWVVEERPQGIYIDAAGERAYVVAIIDCLTAFDCKKKMEFMAKSVMYCGNPMSCVPAAPYATRFIRFAEQIFRPHIEETTQ